MQPGKEGGVVLESVEERVSTAVHLLMAGPEYKQLIEKLINSTKMPHPLSVEETSLVIRGFEKIIIDYTYHEGPLLDANELLAKYRDNGQH